MNHTRKRSYSIISVVILTLIALLLSSPYPIYLHMYNVECWEYKVENFEEYKQDFEAVANFCLEYLEDKFEDSGKEYACIAYCSTNDKKNHYLLYYAPGIENNIVIPVSEALQKNINNIGNAFSPKKGLDVIYCFPDKVSFAIENFRYAVVYTANGEKPNAIVFSKKDERVHTKKINHHWYHVAEHQK